MVLLAAAVCTKSGKTIFSRQFMDITRSRIDGLLAAFPKLVNAEQQHTFIETDAVRYVYQPMESLYMVLITTKNSNILEDLETLRLFAKVVPEYCKVISEVEVAHNAFELIFAFDEIVALGYRESVNLSQIRTFTEMDSHEENEYKRMMKNKEKEAKENAKRREKELQLQRRLQQKAGGKGGGFAGGFGSESGQGPSSGGYGGGMSSSSSMSSSAGAAAAPSYAAPVASGSSSSSSMSDGAKKAGRGMKLGGKPKTNDFVDALIAEGELPLQKEAAPARGAAAAAAAAPAQPAAPTKDVSIRVDETITLTANHDGGMENMEVKGIMMLSITNPDNARIRVTFTKRDDPSISYQSHPNVDKKLMTNDSIIALKAPDRPFPVGTELGVVKWRFQTTDESFIPLTINCWPTVNSDGSCDVNIDYELQNTDLELHDVAITVPLPGGGGAPVIGSCDGEYSVDSRRSILEWRLPLVDGRNRTGALEFSTRARDAGDFFPVLVAFTSHTSYAGVKVTGVTQVDGGDAVPYSLESKFITEKYEIV